MSALSAYHIDGTSGARRQRRQRMRKSDHVQAAMRRRDQERRARKHRARWYEAAA